MWDLLKNNKINLQEGFLYLWIELITQMVANFQNKLEICLDFVRGDKNAVNQTNGNDSALKSQQRMHQWMKAMLTELAIVTE